MAKSVKMYGVGNFIIDSTLYVFKGGEVGEMVELIDPKHEDALKAESARRKANYDRLKGLIEVEAKNLKKAKAK